MAQDSMSNDESLLTSQHWPSGSTTDVLGSTPILEVPIWCAENMVKAFFLMPASTAAHCVPVHVWSGLHSNCLSAQLPV